jgi:hypothetical protein
LWGQQYQDRHKKREKINKIAALFLPIEKRGEKRRKKVPVPMQHAVLAKKKPPKEDTQGKITKFTYRQAQLEIWVTGTRASL